jgi:pilus assembly protein Flp/PilA
MRSWFEALSRMCRDESGGETLEYALVSGLIVIGAISVIGKVGTKVAAKWSSLNSSL